MATGDIITATRYNQIQATVGSVLGIGAANSGYGIPLASSQVNITKTITAEDMAKLRKDMLAIYVHQTGSNTEFSLPIIEKEDFISDSPIVGKNEYDIYTAESNRLLTNRNNYDPDALLSNFTLEPNKIISTRSTSWGGDTQSQSIFHEVEVRFASANARRHFFNTGSEIRFAADLKNFPGGDGQLKFNNWSDMFTAMGTVRFKSFETTVSPGAGGTTQPIGNFGLTNTYQVLFIKSGSGLYSDNTYVIKGRAVNSSTISFLIEFNDLDVGSNQDGFGPVDEPVEGILTSQVDQFRATGTITGNVTKVIVASPVYRNTITL